MAQTVIQHAKELVATIGKEEAIKTFEKMIGDLSKHSFRNLFKESAYETAIEYIKENY